MPATDPAVSLTRFINEDRPFGPTSTEDVLVNREAWEQIFDRDNSIYHYLDANDPVFLIGRRGSGKTAFLNGGRYRDRWKIDLTAPAAVSAVRDTLQRYSELDLTTSVEHWERLWNVALWHVVFNAIIQVGSNATVSGDWRLLDRYMHELVGEERVRDATGADVVSSVCRALRQAAGSDTDDPVHERPELLTLGSGVSVAQAIEAAESLLDDVSPTVELRMDSMEQLRSPMKQYELALSGLYAHVWRSANDSSPYTVRLALPAEIWHVIKEYSSAPLRHFERNVILQWKPADLAKLAAQRFRLFLEEFHPDALSGTGISTETNELISRGDAYRLLNEVLPEQVVGELQIPELPIHYIMRHTQLNPRQFLQILNSICAENRKMGFEATDIQPLAVIDGIRKIEENIIFEIRHAYESVYPEAEEVCGAVLSELPRVFSHGELERVFRRVGASAVRRVWERLNFLSTDSSAGIDEYRLMEPDYVAVKAMLTEIGCIGKVTKYNDTHVTGEFEYSAPSRLQMGTGDSMCVHPLFSGVFSSMTTTGAPWAVQPKGTEIDLEL